MKTVNVTEFENANEFIVERAYCGEVIALGKVLMKEGTLHLNNKDLETVWDLANWGCSQPEEVILQDEVTGRYDGMKAYVSGEMIYLPLKEVSVCNDDVFIRKHYDTEIGYYIYNNNRKVRDEWRYGTRNSWLDYMRACRRL